MGSLAKVVQSLQGTTNRLITSLATDSAFILRATKTSNNKGGKVGAFVPTTTTAHDCFYAPIPQGGGDEREASRGGQRKPVVYHRFVFRSDVDVIATDKVRLVSVRDVAQKDLPIVRVAEPIGLTIEVIAVEEVPVS